MEVLLTIYHCKQAQAAIDQANIFCISGTQLTTNQMASKYGLSNHGLWVNTHILNCYLVAYYTQNTLDQLRTIDDHPQLLMIQVPDGAYKCARNPKRPAREMNTSSKPLLHHPYLYQVNSTWFLWFPVSNPFSNRRGMLIRMRMPHKKMVIKEKS